MQSNLASKFTEAADDLQRRIDDLRNSGTARQRATARRQQIVEQQLREARQIEKTQSALRALAAGWSSGFLPRTLMKLSQVFQVETLLRNENLPSQVGWNERGYKAMVRASIHSDALFFQARADLLALMPPDDDFAGQRERIRQMERDLALRNIPDFFPTPLPIIHQMMVLAGIETRQRVLEPQAGSGNIADIIRQHYPMVALTCVEINYDLAALLRLKGHHVEQRDFFEHTGQYDRIVQNPPFSRMAEIEHIRHAYQQLAPGGRLVSLASMSPFCQNNRRAEGFRQWFSAVGGWKLNLPADAFKSADRPTGTQTCVVVINNLGGHSDENQI